ncbi:hypothetical protein EMCG_04312 [[Emmonsia] crescens]|uniref:Uncharacterized protein n=1 Tax=[Emmonsia] crescens TaxID=73230 RepID=A0A0G2HSR1_9EURO|nr:hypothetical protein EMCG_04312 [Emmonsia crescens UAMH 3008]
MASSALFSSHRALRHPALPVSPLTCSQLLPPTISSTSQTFRSPASLHSRQQRSLFWWSRNHDPEWRSQGKSRLERLMQKEKEMQSFYNKYVTHAKRRRPYIYQSWRSNKSHGPERASRFHRRWDVYDEPEKVLGKRNEWGKSWVAKEHGSKNGFEESESPGEKNGFDSWDGKEREFGESMRRESEQRFEKLKEALDHDPYGLIFGRRLQPFPFGLKEGSWLSFYKSLFGDEGPLNRNPCSSSPGDPRKPPINIGTEPGATTSSEMKFNEDHSPSSNTTTDVAFEFDPVSGRMVPARTRAIDSQTDDTSPIILSNPRDGEAEAETYHEQSNSKPELKVDMEEPVVIEPEQSVSSKTVYPDDANDQSNSKPAQNVDTGGPGAIEPKQPTSSEINSADNAISSRIAAIGDTTEAPQTIGGQKVDTERPVVESNQPVSRKTALGDDAKDAPKPDVWLMGEPDNPAGAKVLTSNSEEAKRTTLDAKNKTSIQSSSRISEELAANRAADWQTYRRIMVKWKDRLDNSGRIAKELEGMSHADYLRHVEAPNASPVGEIYQKAYGVSDGSQAEEDLDRLRASDIRASYKTRAEGHDGAKKTYEGLQDADCGLDIDELRWKVSPNNNNAGNVETAQDSVSPATDPMQKVIDSLLDDDDIGGTKRGKVTYIRNIGGDGEPCTTASGSKRDEIHPVFGIKTTDANLHSEIGHIARELREIKETTNSMNAHLTEHYIPSETAVDAGTQNNNRNAAASSERMKNAMEEREKQIANIGETLSDVKNINNSIASLLTELGEDTQRMRSIMEEDTKKPPLDQNVSKENTPSQYRVLAYDSLTMEMKDVSISSGHSGSNDIAHQLHPTEALSRLNNPSRFLEHFPLLEAQGYEIVSGSGDILIFKKVSGGQDVTGTLKTASPDATAAKKRDGDAYGDGDAMLHSPAQAAQLEKEAIDQFESGLVTAEPPPPPSSSSSSSSSERTETRKGNNITPASEETSSHAYDKKANQLSFDYSEEAKQQQQQQNSSTPPPPKTKKRPPFLRKTLRRVLLTGGVAAGTCYAFGVVAEYFRTGGHDGLGPQGFTGLEGR